MYVIVIRQLLYKEKYKGGKGGGLIILRDREKYNKISALKRRKKEFEKRNKGKRAQISTTSRAVDLVKASAVEAGRIAGEKSVGP